ncbi:MAG: S-layer homology domain-containing protein [Oscillospiraceae bacterium]|nr:S-layer homology domain-containing protein [Oscillospiraceae bacterium]
MLVRLGYYLPSAEPSFSDAESISPWARQAIGALQRAGIIQGDGGRFDPKDIFSREMGVVTVMNFLEYLK